MADYIKINDPELQKRLRARYAGDIDALSSLGFIHLANCIETLGPLSGIYLFPMAILMRVKGEILVFRSPLRLGVANVLLGNLDPPTIALCMAMGVKLYTGFMDGTFLISTTFESSQIPGPASPIIKQGGVTSVESAWTSHREKINQMTSVGYVIQQDVSFDQYVRLSLQEEDLSQYG